MSKTRRSAPRAGGPRGLSQGPASLEMRLAATFQVQTHTLHLFATRNHTWVAVVDDSQLPGRFITQVEAWEAGIREAGRIDRACNDSVA